MLLRAGAALLAMLALGRGADANLATGVAPSLYDYDYNGVTTYCYWIKQGLNVTSFDYSYVKLEGKGNECPLLITIAQTTTGSILAGSDVEYQFTATLNFNDNSFGMTALEATVLDPTTLRPVQIAHANVHACSRTTVCDVFRDGANRRISAQETSNFTDDKASFTQKVNFAKAGDYNVFAHIILPPKNAATETYQFVTFTTTTIGTSAATTTATADSSGMGTGTMIGLIVGAVALMLVIVIGVIFYRRKPMQMSPGNDHFRHSGFAPSRTTKSKSTRLDWNGDPDFQFGHDRYQASMVSEYSKKSPALDASTLMFKDNRSSRKLKTASSGGSSIRSAGSPRSRDNIRRTQGIQLPADHGINTYDTYYHEDAQYEVGSSYTTDSSIGTSQAYASDGHMYAANGARTNGGGASHRGFDNRPAPPLYESSRASSSYQYDRESDLSSLNDDEYDDSRHMGKHGGLGALAELERDSTSSMGTVDFALPPPLPLHPALRPTGDSFCTEDVPNLADTKLAFNDDEISKATIEYIDSLRHQNYRDTGQASDYVSDFGETNRTFDFRDSNQSDLYSTAYRSTDHQFTDTEYREKKRTTSNESEMYEF